MSGAINYISCALLWIALLFRLPDLARRRIDPSLRAIVAVLGFASLCFLFGAPPTVALINRLTGVPNIAAPLTYAAITAYSAALLILIACWRDGPSMRRTTRKWIYGYAVVLAGIAVLFAAGSPAEERRTDFDTYFATTPWVAEMIVLYLLAHLTAVTVSATWALRWAREKEVRQRPWLRASLLTIGTGTVLSAGYSISKLAAVGARWSGRDWPQLGISIPPLFAGLGALLTVTGVLLPLAGHHFSSWGDFVRLAPLDAVLDPVLTDRALRLERPRSPFLWATWRRSTILNGLHEIETLFDRGLYDHVVETEFRRLQERGRRRGRSVTAHELATSAAWAATIAAAAQQSIRPSEPSGEPAPLALPRNPRMLVLIADAIRRSERESHYAATDPARAGSA
ncbi:MAB_1171c family putative transporter [Streptomyces sp. NPDC006476]|uniref:MAB_1171c family putative transporter n=1 Tax=Streptomyces sp. NPDC006476 TaxID=3157175 RepID=UPI0033BF2714